MRRNVLACIACLMFASEAEAGIIATSKASTPHPGVTLIEGTTRAPSSAFHAAQISLCHAGVRVSATKPATKLRTVPAFAAAVGADVALNGDFYKPGPRVTGIAVGDGVAWPLGQTGVDPAVANEWYYEKFGFIAFGPDFVEYSHTKSVKKNVPSAQGGFSPGQVSHDFPPGTVALVSGFPELVTEGTRYACDDPKASTCFPDRADMRARHPRSAMGLSQDKRTFLLVAVDGRSTTSAGMYGTELAMLMEELGAWQAFNLDGGGSTEMWIRGHGTVNTPSDGTSRGVANHWAIHTGTGAAAHCLPEADTGATLTSDLRSETDSDALPWDQPPAEATQAGCSTDGTGARPPELGLALLVGIMVLLRRRNRLHCGG